MPTVLIVEDNPCSFRTPGEAHDAYGVITGDIVSVER